VAQSVAEAPVTDAVARPIKALVFDVFGTVVDWRTSIAEQVAAFARPRNLTVDGFDFADAWRAGYRPAMDRVRSGHLPWTKLDDLHRAILDTVLDEFGISDVPLEERQELNQAWHRLRPWPDAVAGLIRLKRSFIIAPLSNANLSLMTDLSRFSGLPWDCILGAELVRHYKPDPEVYLSAAELLDLPPRQIMMVAAHLGDLQAAKAVGLATAFVPRPTEFGPNGSPDLEADASVDLVAHDFDELAQRLERTV
jgi:2-haloacid dehalogenase